MRVFRGSAHALHSTDRQAVTIGNFDGVHRGHQAMLALLKNEAQNRRLASCVLTFEPHPRDFFAAQASQGRHFSTRVSTLRDKLCELERCGIDTVRILPFNEKLAAMSPQRFVDEVLLRTVRTDYLLVGDDFRFGAARAGDYAFLDACGRASGFDVARMNSYEVHGERVSSSAVRTALRAGNMCQVARLLGRAYSISGHVVHGRKLGRTLGRSDMAPLGFRTLNLRFSSRHHAWRPAASGIFVAQVYGLGEPGEPPLQGVANLGVRPTLGADDVNGGCVLLETHILNWPQHFGAEYGYGRIIRVELLHKLHDELTYDGLDALTAGIARDCADARQFFEQTKATQTTQAAAV